MILTENFKMTDLAYDFLDWPGIEDVTFGDTRHPKDVMAPRLVEGGVLIEGFFPETSKVSVIYGPHDKTVEMVLEDEAGFFAAVIPEKKIPEHYFEADGEYLPDLYAFPSAITAETQGEFEAGIAYDIYKYLGAHPRKLKGVRGTLFAVWAPNAVRVSVVGDFNNWDGRTHLMECHEESGIFELFVPGVGVGDLYKFELRLPSGDVVMKTDPFGFQFEERPGNAAIVADLGYRWHDRDYLEKRRADKPADVKPLAICEVGPTNIFYAAPDARSSDNRFEDKLIAFAEDRGYTHLECLPLMEYPDDDSAGYQTSGFYAPTARVGSPKEIKASIDHLHSRGIGIILDWSPAQFAADRTAMAEFDGTCLFEHLDPRQGVHPMWGSRLFNYGRPQVRNFLIANALFWLKEYHVDGLRLEGCSTILRLDYGRQDGQWIPNLYGSCENLEGIEFIRHLNSVVHRVVPDAFMIAEEDVNWPDMTGPVDDRHLGFDFKWNLHFTNDLIRYLTTPVIDRPHHYDDLTTSMLYNYLDRHIISLSRNLTIFEREQMLNRLPEKEDDKTALLRAAYTFLFAHPGKKLIAAGEEFDSVFFRDLLSFYRNHPALYADDYRESGFEWINAMDAEKCVVSFIRRAHDPETGRDETLIAVCHFSAAEYPGYSIGVPEAGVYEEIFNTDRAVYGGFGDVNDSRLTTSAKVTDGRENTLTFRLAPYAACVFRQVGIGQEDD